MNTWVKVILDSPSKVRKNLRMAVLNGLKTYNAKFKKTGVNESWDQTNDVAEYFRGPNLWKITKTDEAVRKFHNDLKNERGFEFVGIVPWIDYIMESGSQEKLEALWNHEFGSASLLYKVKGLPALVIVNPDMALHDATVNKIPGNTKTPMRGISG